MSDRGSDHFYIENTRLNRTAPAHEISEVYHITRGTFNEFKLKGYHPPRTAISLSKEYKIPVDKNRDIFLSVTKRAKEPDPSTYAAESEKVYKRYWDKANGKFHPGRRSTFTEETIKISKKLPGPGAYMPIPKGEPIKRTAKLGKFDKDKIDSFLCNTEALSEEVPGANLYFQKPEDREKAYSKRETKQPGFKYYPAKPEKVEKGSVGPGYLKDLESSYGKNALRKKTPDPAFSKAKIECEFSVRANSKKYVPGVGAYKDSERAFTSFTIAKKERVPFISKYQFTRFTEAVSKDKQWVPGPGSYNVIPYSTKSKKD